MYMKDKSNRVTLRLNDEQFAFVKLNADSLGVSPSEFLRIVVNATMTASQKIQNKLQEGQGRENDEANIDNLV